MDGRMVELLVYALLYRHCFRTGHHHQVAVIAVIAAVAVAWMPSLQHHMAKLEHLPPELLRLILLQAAYSSTKQALNLALVCHTLFDWVRPALHASVALRTRDHLEHYAQLVSADPERAAGLRNLYLNNRSDGDPAPALPETTVEGVANWESGDQWATNSLETICERCVNLEVLHVWEPFTINYP